MIRESKEGGREGRQPKAAGLWAGLEAPRGMRFLLMGIAAHPSSLVRWASLTVVFFLDNKMNLCAEQLSYTNRGKREEA